MRMDLHDALHLDILDVAFVVASALGLAVGTASAGAASSASRHYWEASFLFTSMRPPAMHKIKPVGRVCYAQRPKELPKHKR